MHLSSDKGDQGNSSDFHLVLYFSCLPSNHLLPLAVALVAPRQFDMSIKPALHNPRLPSHLLAHEFLSITGESPSKKNETAYIRAYVFVGHPLVHIQKFKIEK